MRRIQEQQFGLNSTKNYLCPQCEKEIKLVPLQNGIAWNESWTYWECPNCRYSFSEQYINFEANYNTSNGKPVTAYTMTTMFSPQ
jgi:ribosomal protein L37AE/L43A